MLAIAKQSQRQNERSHWGHKLRNRKSGRWTEREESRKKENEREKDR